MDGITGMKKPAESYRQPFVDVQSYGFLNISDKISITSSKDLNMDSFQKYDPDQWGSCISEDTLREAEMRLNGIDPVASRIEENRPLLSKMDAAISRFFDGTFSQKDLQREYEKQAEEYLQAFRGCRSDGLKQKAAEEFYSMFRMKVIGAAVDRNTEEGRQYITGELNGQRSWKYYNSDYYFESEAAITAITSGAEAVAQKQSLPFQVPDYKGKGLNLYHNFNSAWSNHFSRDEQYLRNPDMVPPQNFKWFYEEGGTDDYSCLYPSSLTITSPDGTKTVINYETDEFDPTDPTKARTWASYTDENGTEHRISKAFQFDFSENDLSIVAALMSFSSENTTSAGILNQFLENLQVYPVRYFSCFPGGRFDFRA